MNEAIVRHGCPDIFNTNQGSQFTRLLKEYGIRIGMDDKGCWRNNVFVERLWKSVKYKEVYLRDCDPVSEAKVGLEGTSTSTTPGGRINRLTVRCRMRFTSIICRRKNRSMNRRASLIYADLLSKQTELALATSLISIGGEAM